MNEEQLQALPESVREWDEAVNSDTPEIFWDRMSNMRSKIGTGLYQPGEDAGTEDWGKFSNKAIELSGDRLMPRPDLEDEDQRNALYKTLGRPDESSGYEFDELEGVNGLSDERKKFIQELAFKANVTGAQLKILDNGIRQADHDANAAVIEGLEDGLKDLKQEWGLATDERIHEARKIVDIFFPHIDKDAILTQAELKSFYSLSKQLGTGSSEFTKQGDQHKNGLSPADAEMKISEIRNNKDHPYNNTMAAGHNTAKKQMRALYLAKNGQPPE